MAYCNPGPLSIAERKATVKKLREEANKFLLEAERIEAGIESDEKTLQEMIKKAVEVLTPVILNP